MRGAIDMLNRFEFVWVLLLTLVTPAYAADAPGVTKTEIKIGATFPFSGPASSLGNNGRGLMAYVQSINATIAAASMVVKSN